MPDNKLTRLTFGFNKCSKPLPLVSIQLHTSNKSLEEVLLKERKRKKEMMVLLRPKLLPKLRHEHKPKPKPKLKMEKRLIESVKPKLRSNVRDKPKRKSNSVFNMSSKSKSN